MGRTWHTPAPMRLATIFLATAMLAAQGRADALEKSRKAAAQEQAREQFSRFMTGSSYSPTTVRMFHD